MKVICNRSDECGDAKCVHVKSHKARNDCSTYLCSGTVGFPKCIEDTASEIKPIRFELVDD